MNLKTLLARLIRSELIKGSMWLFIGGMFGNLVAFLFNLFLARKLSYADYGTYASLLSLFTLLTIPAGSLTAVVVRFATHYFTNDEGGKAKDLYKKMSLFWGVTGFALFLSLLLLTPILRSFLHIDSLVFIPVVGVAVGLSYFGIVNIAFVQSLSKFAYLSFSLAFGNFFRLVGGAILVLVGFKVLGALVGILLTPMIILFLCFIPLVNLIKNQNETVKTDWKEIIKYALPTSMAILALSSFITTDVLLVKHFFQADMAGSYGGLSIIGKVIFYFTAFIPTVMFPLIVKRHTKGESYVNTYLLGMFIVGSASLFITAIYFLIPELIIGIFLGQHYLHLASYLGLFGIFITLFNLNSVTLNFFLSIKKTNVFTLVFLFAIVQVALISVFHDNFTQIIYSSILSLFLLMIFLFFYFWKTTVRK